MTGTLRQDLGRLGAGVLLPMLLVLALAACGEDSSEQTKAGIAWLQGKHTMPAKSGWILGEITAPSGGHIDIDVDIDNVTQAISMKSLSATDKGEVARLACPWPESEFWTLAGAKTKVVIRLKSMGSTVVTASCRRP